MGSSVLRLLCLIHPMLDVCPLAYCCPSPDSGPDHLWGGPVSLALGICFTVRREA